MVPLNCIILRCSKSLWNYDNLSLSLFLFIFQQKNASFFQFQRKPGDCVLASTVAFNRNDKCTWLCLYLFDCCRDCNAKHYKCRQKFPGDDAAPECYRDHYGCMRRCLLEHNPPENVQSAQLLALMERSASPIYNVNYKLHSTYFGLPVRQF